MPDESSDQKSEARRLVELEAKMELDKRKSAGKKGELWRVTVHYDLDGVDTAHYIDNRYWDETLRIRERLFSAGLMVPYDAAAYLVIPPTELKAIFITKQSHFFNW